MDPAHIAKTGPALPVDTPPSYSQTVYEAAHLVAMIDVDAAQIHFSTYFRWMDLGTSGLMAQLGIPVRDVLASGFSMPVVDAHCAYRAPVGLGSIVTCRSYFAHCGTTSLQSRHDFTTEGHDLATGTLTHVWMAPADGGLVPREVPLRLREAVREPADTP